MDGVLAKWNSLASQEDTFEKGYFLNRKPDNKAIEYVQNLVNKGNDVCILSHAYQNGYASIEKRKWLDNNGLENIPSIFVPYGVPKLDYIILREIYNNRKMLLEKANNILQQSSNEEIETYLNLIEKISKL